MIMLGSSIYLDLCLVCTHGTPVTDMLAHSPSLPLIIDCEYDDDDKDCDITAEDEEGIILAHWRYSASGLSLCLVTTAFMLLRAG
jgi:hypothetical protein